MAVDELLATDAQVKDWIQRAVKFVGTMTTN